MEFLKIIFSVMKYGWGQWVMRIHRQLKILFCAKEWYVHVSTRGMSACRLQDSLYTAQQKYNSTEHYCCKSDLPIDVK